MMSQLTLLYRYANTHYRSRHLITFLGVMALLAFILACLSSQVMSAPFGIDAEHVGGTPLEIAFWLTALSAAFFSFYMSEIIFRSADVRLLAQLPVSPINIFLYRISFVILLIAIVTLPVSALFFELWQSLPHIAACCTGLFFFGNVLCCVLSTAVLMYSGRTSLKAHGDTAISSQAFMMAPAISLFGSLISVLLLKLLVEALLKPNFIDAALTALSITGMLFIGSVIYALITFKKDYYAVLSNFMDNDAVTLNANYQFVDEATLMHIKTAKDAETAIFIKDKAIVSRRHTLSRILIITLSAILALVGFASPETLSGLHRPSLVVSLCFMLGPTWLWLKDAPFDRRLPVSPTVRDHARMRAALALTVPNILVLTAAVSLPLLTVSWYQAIVCACLAILFMLIPSAIATYLVCRRPAIATLFSWTVAFLFAFATILCP